MMEQEGFDNYFIKELIIYFIKFKKQGFIPKCFYIAISDEVGFTDNHIKNFNIDSKGYQAKNTYRAMLLMLEYYEKNIKKLSPKEYKEYFAYYNYQASKTKKSINEDDSIWRSVYPNSKYYSLDELLDYAKRVKISLERRFVNIEKDTELTYPEIVILE